MLIFLNLILFAALIAALVKPDKVLPFINTSNGVRRVVAIAAYCVIWAVMATVFGPQKTPDRITAFDDANNKKWNEHAYADSVHMATGHFSADSAKSTLELGARFEELTAIMSQSDYKKDEITDSAVLRFANRNSNIALEKMAELQKSYRDRYAKLLANELWEKNIKVHTLNGGKTIQFVGGVFASNKNIAEFQKRVVGNLRAYGFEKSQYKWIEHDTEIVTYTIE